MKKLYVIPLELADCTCDPHTLTFDGVVEALKAALAVCESDIVQHVRIIYYTDEKDGVIYEFESDRFTESERVAAKRDDGTPKRPPLDFDKKHKVAPYLQMDADVDPMRHLRPGVSGLKDLLYFIPGRLDNGYTVMRFSVGVTWAFAGDSSCSDYLYIVGGEYGEESQWTKEHLEKPIVCTYASQDWYEHYRTHIDMIQGIERITGKKVSGRCWAARGIPYPDDED
jgi:hypothetical protein